MFCYNTCTFPIVKSHSDLYPDADVPQHFLFINIKMISHMTPQLHNMELV